MNLLQKKEKKEPRVNWSASKGEIYKKLVCNVMVSMGTELNNVINNYKSEIHFFLP